MKSKISFLNDVASPKYWN